MKKGKNAWAELKFDGWRSRFNETFKDKDNVVRTRMGKADPALELATKKYPEKIHLRQRDGSWPIEKSSARESSARAGNGSSRWKVDGR